MSNKRNKLAIVLAIIVLCVLSMVIGLLGLVRENSYYAHAESVFNENEIFTFAKTSEEECAVRLKDKTVETAIIPETVELEGKIYTVTSITANGFASATNLKKVRLPKTIISIGQSAFSGCKVLTSITLNAVESIGANAFATTNLEYLIIPETVNKVASSILRNCDTQVYVRAHLLEGETLPEGTWAANWNLANKNQSVEYGSKYIPEIKYEAIMASQTTRSFSYLNNAEDYVVGYHVEEFQEFCSANTNEYKELYIPAVFNGKPVVGIANSAFYYNDVSKIVIGYSENPITIGSYAFDHFAGHAIIINRDIIFEDKDGWGTEIVVSENVFANSELSIVILPDTLNNLGDYAFMNCTNLTDVKFVNPKNCSKKEELAMLDNIEISSTVDLPSTKNFTSIGSYAFCETPNIKKIYIHQNVQNVGNNLLSGWNYTVQEQKAIIDFSNENSLPSGWDILWNENCEEEVIEYNDLSIYTITYILNKERAVHNNPTEITRKDNFILQDARLDGHIFLGWYSNPEFTGDRITEIKTGTKENLTLYGYLTEITYEIRYNKNKPQKASHDIEREMPVQENIRYEQVIQLFSNDYYLKGWEFLGWDTQSDGKGTRYLELEKVSKLTKSNNDTVELFAQWKEKEYSIVYERNTPSNASHTVNGPSMSSQHNYENYDRLLNNAYTLQGWRFDKWTTNKNGTGNSYYNNAQINSLAEEGEVKLYAQWIANTYYVSYVMNKPVPGAIFDGSTSQTTHKYDTMSQLAANGFTSVSFKFEYWETSSGIKKDTAFNLTEKPNEVIYLYAHWSPKSLVDCYNNGIYEIADVSQLRQLPNYATNNWSFKLKTSIDVKSWSAISEFNGTLDLNNYTITYNNLNLSHKASYGFIIKNKGTIKNGDFMPSIKSLDGSFDNNEKYEMFYVGGICAVNEGTIQNCKVLSKIGNGKEKFTSTTKNVDIYVPARRHRAGGVVGENYGIISYCINYASVAGDLVNCGGIAGASWNTSMDNCNNFGNIYVEQRIGGSSNFNYFGGITGVATGPNGSIIRCTNYGKVLFQVQSAAYPQIAYMAQIAGMAHTAVNIENCNCYGNVKWEGVYLVTGFDKYITNGPVGELIDYNYGGGSDNSGGCVATGTYITLADGTKKQVQDLKGNEQLLVWNLYTGTFDVAPILFIDSDPMQIYEVINLYFSDGTNVKVISEHAFWDFDLNEYVFLRNDADKYIGHWFNKQGSGSLSWETVQLIDVKITEEVTTAWSPVTYGHLCYYVNDMLSMPGATEGLINIFEVDSETLKINETLMQADIEQYGLFTYEEFAEIYPITEEIFEAFNGQYLKISVGKGLITMEEIGELINHYADFLS